MRLSLTVLVFAWAVLSLTSCGGASGQSESAPSATSRTRPAVARPKPSYTQAATPTTAPQILEHRHDLDGPAPQLPGQWPLPSPANPGPPPPPPAPPVDILHPPPYTVVLDPGHGGPNYIGAANQGLLEKDVNLDVALRLGPMLSAAGYNVILTRDGDYTLTEFYADTATERRDEIQARVDLANQLQADILVSVHFNGGPKDLNGLEVYYNPDRSFGFYNYMLADATRQALLGGIRDAGYDVPDRGIKNDALVGGDPRNPHSWLLGTNDGFRPSMMPGIIAEAMFLSNDVEAQQLWRPEMRQAIADGYKRGIDGYFAWLQTQLPATPTPTPTPTPPPTPTPAPPSPTPSPTLTPSTPSPTATPTMPPTATPVTPSSTPTPELLRRSAPSLA